MELKIMLISILIYVVIVIATRTSSRMMSAEEKIKVALNDPPVHIEILGLLVVVSSVETIISIIVWIISL